MLSKESKIVLHELYNQYLSRRNHGLSKRKAASFSSSISVKNDFFPDMHEDDVLDALCSLGENGYINIFFADGIVYYFSLTEFAIATLENEPKETFLSVADFISKFFP